MASSPPPPPPPALPPAPTTISSLNDDLLREIFLRLPAVTSLARAAFSCRDFLRAVRSSPSFRCHFRELHAPPLLAIFLVPYMRAFVPAAGGKDSFESPGFANLIQDDADSEWWTESDNQSSIPYCYGYVSFINRTTEQWVDYSPHSQALRIFPKKPHVGDDTCIEFHSLSPDGEEQRPSRVVCVHYEYSWAWARVAVFSSDTMEWQILPMEWNILAETGTLPLEGEGEGEAYMAGKVVSEFICWIHRREGHIVALNTATFQVFRMDLPLALKLAFSKFKLGQTKGGKLCIVDVHECKLSVWLWTANHDGVDKFMLNKMFPMQASVKETIERPDVENVQVEIMMVINGFVYLSVSYWEPQPLQPPRWFLSFCLETAEVNLLFRIRHLSCPMDPYILTSWPSSLIQNKLDSETGVTGDISEDNGPMGTATEETSPVLFTALHSFKETLIDDSNVNFTEIDAFLLDDEKNSLVDRIITLESRLATARERVLRIGIESDNKKGMERGSWWQMWKGRLGRAWSQFFTG